MLLKIVLNIDSVDDTVWSEYTTGEEEREKGLGEQTAIICAPDHRWEGRGVRVVWEGPFRMEQGSVSGREVKRINPASGECPERCT